MGHQKELSLGSPPLGGQGQVWEGTTLAPAVSQCEPPKKGAVQALLQEYW